MLSSASASDVYDAFQEAILKHVEDKNGGRV